jgi:hypothetical protein
MGLMTYAIRKRQAGQEVVKKLTLMLNACKYTKEPYISRQYLNVSGFAGPFSDSYTGSVPSTIITPSSDYVTTWSSVSDLYALSLATGEIIKISISTALSFNVIARGQFGTASEEINGGDEFTIMHEGRANGSCYGYSQTCSSGDSYDSEYHGGLVFNNISYSSAELKPGEAISSRSRLSFKIYDFIHNDYDTVFWSELRTSAGTFFGKMIARHPYFNNRKIKYSVGLRDSGSLDEPDWEERYLLIDSINLDRNTFSGTALDPLILTEGKKSKMPLASPAQLVAVITSGSTLVQFGNAPADYFGTSGNIIVRIDSELIEVTATGGIAMNIVTRGYGNSTIKDHSINATVQNCIRFQDEHVIDCITYALETWTSTPAEYIDDYSDVIALNPSAIIKDYIISSPRDVVDFINSCILIGNLDFYFDDVAQKIVINYIYEFNASAITLGEFGEIKKETAKRDFNSKEQYTRFNLSWAPFDLTKETDDKNYQISLTAVSSDLESPSKLGEVNEKKSMMLPMLTADSDDYLLGADIVNRFTFNNLPDIFECELDAESIGETQGSALGLGTIVNVESQANQNKAGIPEPRLYKILRISGDPFESYKVKMKHIGLQDPDDFDYVIEDDTYINYVLTDNFNPVSPGEYTIYIKTGAIFGSYSTSLPAFKTGTPSSGVTFRFVARWQILAMGGAGGNGGTSTTPASNGSDGGVAFEANCDVEIDNSVGLIWAGGGGGGGTPYIPPVSFNPPSATFGGGGGQGFGSSIGGLNTNGTSSTTRAQNGGQAGPGTQPGNDGGEWGLDGDTNGGGLGGLSGIAIKSNGFNVTITAGDNELSIRGRRT